MTTSALSHILKQRNVSFWGLQKERYKLKKEESIVLHDKKRVFFELASNILTPAGN